MSQSDGDIGCRPRPTTENVHRIWPNPQDAAPAAISFHEVRSRPLTRFAVNQQAAAPTAGAMH